MYTYVYVSLALSIHTYMYIYIYNNNNNIILYVMYYTNYNVGTNAAYLKPYRSYNVSQGNEGVLGSVRFGLFPVADPCVNKPEPRTMI